MNGEVNGGRILTPTRPFSAREQQMHKEIRALGEAFAELQRAHHQLQVVLWHSLRDRPRHRLEVTIAELDAAERKGDKLGLMSHRAIDDPDTFVFSAEETEQGDGPDAAA